jgi:hypothetical protein
MILDFRNVILHQCNLIPPLYIYNLFFLGVTTYYLRVLFGLLEVSSTEVEVILLEAMLHTKCRQLQIGGIYHGKGESFSTMGRFFWTIRSIFLSYSHHTILFLHYYTTLISPPCPLSPTSNIKGALLNFLIRKFSFGKPHKLVLLVASLTFCSIKLLKGAPVTFCLIFFEI